MSQHLLSRFIAVITIGFSLNLHAVEASKSIVSQLADNNAEESFLPPDVAFKLDLTAQDAQTVQAAFKVVPGYYLYRERIKFEIAPNNINKIKSII